MVISADEFNQLEMQQRPMNCYINQNTCFLVVGFDPKVNTQANKQIKYYNTLQPPVSVNPGQPAKMPSDERLEDDADIACFKA